MLLSINTIDAGRHDRFTNPDFTNALFANQHRRTGRGEGGVEIVKFFSDKRLMIRATALGRKLKNRTHTERKETTTVVPKRQAKCAH